MKALIFLSLFSLSSMGFAQDFESDWSDDDIRSYAVTKVKACDIGARNKKIDEEFERKSIKLCSKKGFSNYRLYQHTRSNFCLEGTIECL